MTLVLVIASLVVVAGAIAVFVKRRGATTAKRPTIDPFTLSEPWRRLVQDSQRSGRRLRETVAGGGDGPLAANLRSIADELDRGLDEAYDIAKAGDDLDDAVRRLDPTAMRAKLDTLRRAAGAEPSDSDLAAIESLQRQIDTADRLREQSAATAAELRLHQTRLDELVARASEVRLGAVDTDSYARDVDDLVVRLEALHQAIEEVGRQ